MLHNCLALLEFLASYPSASAGLVESFLVFDKSVNPLGVVFWRWELFLFGGSLYLDRFWFGLWLASVLH